MNKLSIEQQAKVIACIVEGCSIRATVRMTGTAKKTVSRLLVEVGWACEAWMDKNMRNLKCKRLQFDEIWAFVYSKQRTADRTEQADNPYIGDIWTWVVIDADTKLIPWWHVSKRTAADAWWFAHDVANRMSERVQLTTDGLQLYLDPMRSAFGRDKADYAILMKLYGLDPMHTQSRYSPPMCVGARKKKIFGEPDQAHISTSFVERQNLTMRMGIRRFTRLTNGFSKKFRNHRCAVALHFAHYNLCRVHQTLGRTPAMEAGLTDHVWSIEELLVTCGPTSSFAKAYGVSQGVSEPD